MPYVVGVRGTLVRHILKPWCFKNYEDIVLGERIQVDHMTRTINGITVRHFSAWERVSKWSYAQIYSNAKAKSAKKF